MNVPLGGGLVVLGIGLLYLAVRKPLARWNARASRRLHHGPGERPELHTAQRYQRNQTVAGLVAVAVGIVLIVVGLIVR